MKAKIPGNGTDERILANREDVETKLLQRATSMSILHEDSSVDGLALRVKRGGISGLAYRPPSRQRHATPQP
jgi:hypothetical protein